MLEEDIKPFHYYVNVGNKGKIRIRGVLSIWMTQKKDSRAKTTTDTWWVRFRDMQRFPRPEDIRTVKMDTFLRWAKREATPEEVRQILKAIERANRRPPTLGIPNGCRRI